MKNALKPEKKFTPALSFVLLMGVVSMFSDMTHEGARSIYGSFLNLLGASAATIGFVSGFGEMIGHSLRLLTGFIADKLKKYWAMAFIGYAVNMAAVPLLALSSKNGWLYAGFLIIAERMGKAIRQPSKNTLVSFASKQLGEGKAFAIQEFLDQIGAFTGPLILFFVMLLKRGSEFDGYIIGFAALAVPAALTLAFLLTAKRKFPNPELFETDCGSETKLRLRPGFVLYMAAISLLALGFADFPLITMHLARNGIMPADFLPLAYSGAMLVDAFSALFFGRMYDRRGFAALMASSALSACFPVLIFGFNTVSAAAAGIALWGIGMGAQESVLKSAVAALAPKNCRASGFGIFETVFGAFWFVGSWIMGILYDNCAVIMIIFSTAAQALSVPVFYLSNRAEKKRRAA